METLRQWAKSPLGLAFILSILFHLVSFGIYRAGKKIHWDGQDKLLAMLVPKPSNTEMPLLKLYQSLLFPQPDPRLAQQRPPPQTPQMFISVDPLQATAEAPKNPKYYSALNSQAANPVKKANSDEVNIDGRQKNMMQAIDIPVPVVSPELRRAEPPTKASPQNPEPPQPKPVEKTEPEQLRPELKPKPKGGETPGQLALAKPVDVARPNDGQAHTEDGKDDRAQKATPDRKPVRPRTVAEAKAHLANNQIAGERIQQPGGVPNFGIVSSLDAKATPFGAYDAIIIAAVQQRWWNLLEDAHYSLDRHGHVSVDFTLHADGTVRAVTEAENTTGVLWGAICQRAISEVSPFKPWTQEMLQFYGTNQRHVRFTFYYY